MNPQDFCLIAARSLLAEPCCCDPESMERLSSILYWKIPFDQGRISSLMYTQHLASSCHKNAWYPSRRKQSKIPRPNPSKPSFPWFHLRSVAGSQLHYHLQTIGLPSFTYIPMLSVMYKPSPEKSEGKIRRALFHSVNFNLVYNPNMENWSCDIG